MINIRSMWKKDFWEEEKDKQERETEGNGVMNMFKLYGLYFNKNVIIEPTLYNKYTLTKFLFIYYGGPNDTGSHKLIYLNTLSPADGTIWEGLGCQSSSCSLLETGILLLCHV